MLECLAEIVAETVFEGLLRLIVESVPKTLENLFFSASISSSKPTGKKLTFSETFKQKHYFLKK